MPELKTKYMMRKSAKLELSAARGEGLDGAACVNDNCNTINSDDLVCHFSFFFVFKFA